MDELQAFAERHTAWAKKQLEDAAPRARETQDVVEYHRPTLIEEAERLLSYWLAARDAEQRRLGREEGAEAVVAAVAETCREWPEGTDDRCNAPADFILWGKLFPREALGPRCYDHAVEHTHHTMPSRTDQWAVLDLRAARAAAQQVSER